MRSKTIGAAIFFAMLPFAALAQSAPPSSAPQPEAASTQSSEARAKMRAACVTDIQMFCANIERGKGAMRSCLSRIKATYRPRARQRERNVLLRGARTEAKDGEECFRPGPLLPGPFCAGADIRLPEFRCPLNAAVFEGAETLVRRGSETKNDAVLTPRGVLLGNVQRWATFISTKTNRVVMVMSNFGFAEAVRQAKSRMDAVNAAAERGDWVSVEKALRDVQRDAGELRLESLSRRLEKSAV